jgi:hypothetical protein
MSPEINDHIRISYVSSSTTDLSTHQRDIVNESLSTRSISSPPIIIEDESIYKSKHICYDLIALIKELICNLRYMGVTCCAVVEALLIKGYLAFLSKHIEYQFRTTSSHSSVYMGIISLCSVILGAPLGAYIVKRFDMDGRQCAKFSCIILGLSSVFFLGLMLHCREPTIGREVSYSISNLSMALYNIGTTHSMPVIFTAFDDGFFDEPVIESDRIESPCKRKCRETNIMRLMTMKIRVSIRLFFYSLVN